MTRVPVLVKVLAVLLFVGAGLTLIIGLWLLLALLGAGDAGTALIGSLLRTFYSGESVLYAVGFPLLTIIQIAVGVGLWRGSAWARLVAIVFALLGIGFAFYDGFSVLDLLLGGLVAGYLLFSPAVRAAFRRDSGRTTAARLALVALPVLGLVAVPVIVKLRRGQPVDRLCLRVAASCPGVSDAGSRCRAIAHHIARETKDGDELMARAADCLEQPDGCLGGGVFRAVSGAQTAVLLLPIRLGSCVDVKQAVEVIASRVGQRAQAAGSGVRPPERELEQLKKLFSSMKHDGGPPRAAPSVPAVAARPDASPGPVRVEATPDAGTTLRATRDAGSGLQDRGTAAVDATRRPATTDPAARELPRVAGLVRGGGPPAALLQWSDGRTLLVRRGQTVPALKAVVIKVDARGVTLREQATSRTLRLDR